MNNLHKKIFRKLVKTDKRAQNRIRKVWLENQLECIEFDDYFGSEKGKEKKKVIAKSNSMGVVALSNYMLVFYDGPFDIFSKKVINNLTEKEIKFVNKNLETNRFFG